MQKKLFFRAATIAVLILLLMIPLGMIHGVVAERQGLQFQVENTIATTLAGRQRLAGPVLVVPYVAREVITSTDDKGRETKKVLSYERRALFMGEQVTIEVNTGVESRYKGLYKALVFQSQARLQARFEIPANLGLDLDPATFSVGRPWLALGLSDVRGLRGSPAMMWDQKDLLIGNGTQLENLGDGFNAVVPQLDPKKAGRHVLDMNLSYAGTSALAFAPIGKLTTVQMKASWPHPNFGGRFLPQTKQIDDKGFSARWEVSSLASKNADLIRQASTAKTREPADLETFDVSFIEPVNIYQQAERAVKYGILFIALTFAAFFLFELLKDLRIHPLQYGLVGMAIALFFLLLVSLSEHIAFAHAYLVAAGACVILIGYYLAHVLGAWRRGLAFAAKLALLYAVLYGLLLSEDNALMLGSLLLFCALAAIMVLTRRVDWYAPGVKGNAREKALATSN